MTLVTLVGDFDGRLIVLLDDLERPVLLVARNLGVVNLTTNETLGVEDRVLWVGVVGVLGRISDTVGICELGNGIKAG